MFFFLQRFCDKFKMRVFGQYFGVFRYVISSVGEVLEKQYGNKKTKRDWTSLSASIQILGNLTI